MHSHGASLSMCVCVCRPHTSDSRRLCSREAWCGSVRFWRFASTCACRRRFARRTCSCSSRSYRRGEGRTALREASACGPTSSWRWATSPSASPTCSSRGPSTSTAPSPYAPISSRRMPRHNLPRNPPHAHARAHAPPHTRTGQIDEGEAERGHGPHTSGTCAPPAPHSKLNAALMSIWNPCGPFHVTTRS